MSLESVRLIGYHSHHCRFLNCVEDGQLCHHDLQTFATNGAHYADRPWGAIIDNRIKCDAAYLLL